MKNEQVSDNDFMSENKSGLHIDRERFSQVFEHCFHLYYEGLYRYAYTIVRNNHDAADIVQLVFAKWWEKGEQLVIIQDTQHYLFRTVRNQALNVVRNRKTRKTELHDFSTPQKGESNSFNSDPLLGKEMMARLNAELEKLPPQCKLIFYKSRFEEKKYAEIAEELGLSIKTIETQIGKALKILRQKLFEDTIGIFGVIILLLSIIF